MDGNHPGTLFQGLSQCSRINLLGKIGSNPGIYCLQQILGLHKGRSNHYLRPGSALFYMTGDLKTVQVGKFYLGYYYVRLHFFEEPQPFTAVFSHMQDKSPAAEKFRHPGEDKWIIL